VESDARSKRDLERRSSQLQLLQNNCHFPLDKPAY
jgi:hypothetical protein